MKAIIREKVYSQFNKVFNSVEEYEQYNKENPNLGVFYVNPSSSGRVSVQYNDIKKYVIIPSDSERNALFKEGEKITINGDEYTMIGVGVDGSYYNRPVIWIE